MKGVAFLAFVAFIAATFPNRVEGDCYACGGTIGRFGKKCEDFETASADQRRDFVVSEPYSSRLDAFLSFDDVKSNGTKRATPTTPAPTEKPASRRRRALSDCSKCSKSVDTDGKVLSRDCTDDSAETRVDKEGKGGYFVCKGYLCNGAGSLKSWTAVALFATTASLLKGSLF